MTYHFLLQGIFSTQRLNLHLLFGRWTHYHCTTREHLIFYITNIASDIPCFKVQFSSVQSLNCVRLFLTPLTAACQASLSTPNSRSIPKLMSVESVIPSTISSSVVPFSSYPQSFPASESFPMSQLFESGGQSIGVSASTSLHPMNTQD